MSAKEIWIVGDWQHAHFAESLNWLPERAKCNFFSDVQSAIASSREEAKNSSPTAILLVQSRPGQISNHDVERLHALAPLARLVGLLGPWCEGELRTGRPWQGVSRVPWRDWRWRLARELGLGEKQSSTHVRHPRVATEADRLQQSISQLSHFGQFTGCAEVLTTSRITYDLWQIAFRLFGVRCCCPALDRNPTAVSDFQIIDGWENLPIRSSPAESPPRVLALHFPRPDDLMRAAQVGLSGVLAQPLLLTDLAVALNSVLPPATVLPRETAA